MDLVIHAGVVYNLFDILKSNTLYVLFIIFINDINRMVDHSKILFHAEDINLLKVVKSIEDCASVQSKVNCIYE